MKAAILFVTMLFALHLGATDNHPRKSERWYSPYLNRQVKIMDDRGGILVKGIFRSNRWTYFEYAGRNEYVSRSGDRLIFARRDVAVFTSRHDRTRLTLVPWSQRKEKYSQPHNRPGNGRWNDCDQDYYDEKEYFDDEYDYNNNYDRYRQSDHRGSQTGSNSTIPGNRRSIEGTWLAEGTGRKVYILDTRDGLKARLEDDARWYKFYSDQSNDGMYTADQGQTYRWTGQNTLEWTDKEGKKRFILKKISDHLD